MDKVLIVDIPIPLSIYSQLEQLGLIMLDAETLMQKFIKNYFWDKFNPSSTLFVFPGNGASIVRGYFPDKLLAQWQWITVYAKRYWEPGTSPRVIVERIFNNKMVLNLENILIIDDVVSSGKTARLLRTKNMLWFPGANWHLATWVAQNSANVRGYTTFFSVEKVGAKDRKIPINSLSTLVSVPEIAKSYCARYFRGDSSLKLILKKLRGS